MRCSAQEMAKRGARCIGRETYYYQQQQHFIIILKYDIWIYILNAPFHVIYDFFGTSLHSCMRAAEPAESTRLTPLTFSVFTSSLPNGSTFESSSSYYYYYFKSYTAEPRDKDVLRRYAICSRLDILYTNKFYILLLLYISYQLSSRRIYINPIQFTIFRNETKSKQ